MKKKQVFLTSGKKQEVISSYMVASLPEKLTTGNIHSIFKTSLNIKVNNRLYNFSTLGMPLSAHGCLLAPHTVQHLLAASKVGDLFRVSDEIITFYTTAEIIKIDVSTLAAVDLSIPAVQLSLASISERPLFKVLSKISFSEKIGLESRGNNQDAFEMLQNPAAYEKTEVETFVQLLIGRGKGLTPSGDDILMGYLLVRKAFGRMLYIEPFLQQKVNESLTTDISEAYYRALFAGSASSLFVELILSLEDTKEDVEELIHTISLYGHTSGYDTLFGCYLGLRSLINETETRI